MPHRRARRAGRPHLVLLAAIALAVLAGGAWWMRRGPAPNPLPPGDYEARPLRNWETAPERAATVREDALARARVWRAPAVPVERADLARNARDRDPLDVSGTLACVYLPGPARGTTPKFDCVLRGGEIVKVKYGSTNEIPAEVAASRLLGALGFGADRVDLHPHVRCYGCPGSPWRATQLAGWAGLREVLERNLDRGRYTDFTWVTVERRLPEATISAPGVKGWSFDELKKIDPARGGASRAEVDALRLLADFLSHWDNKSENQRLVCLDDPRKADNGPCPRPFAFLQDLGSTFGPDKVDLERWRARPVWSDAPACELSMRDLPFDGATFGTVRIGEPGRLLLGGLLERLSDAQVRDLFTAARFADRAPDAGGGVEEWVVAFREKVRAIVDRPPCPALTSAGGSFPRPPSRPSA